MGILQSSDQKSLDELWNKSSQDNYISRGKAIEYFDQLYDHIKLTNEIAPKEDITSFWFNYFDEDKDSKYSKDEFLKAVELLKSEVFCKELLNKYQSLQTENGKAISKQIEFYFSDSNFLTDTFLKETSEKNDGYVPISVILTFKRMQKFSATEELILIAAKSSPNVVTKDDKLLKRAQPLPEVNTIRQRSIVIKHFDEQEPFEEIEKVFSAYGKILSVRTKKDKSKFKGYVEYSTEEEANSVAAKETVTYKDTTVNVFKRKQKEPKEEKKKEKMVEGVILTLSKVPSSISRNDLAAAFTKYGTVRYTNFRNPETGEGELRFQDAEGAKSALNALKNGEIESLAGVEGRILEGDEDKKYWEENVFPFIQKNPVGKKRKFSGKRGGRKGKN